MRKHIINFQFRSVGMMILPLFAIAACDGDSDRVHITYEQVANFYTYKLSPSDNGSKGAGDGMFVMYRLRRISNTEPGAKMFMFDKHKVVTVTSDQISNEEPVNDTHMLGDQLVSKLTVPAGQTLSAPKGLGCFIKRVSTDQPKKLATISSLLDPIYQVDSQQLVSMHRMANNTSVAIIVGDALPSAPNVGLQQLCNTD